MAPNEDIAQALESLFRESNPNPTFIAIVQQLQAKPGYDLAHKVDFIRAQIQQLFNRHQQQQNQQFAAALYSHNPHYPLVDFGAYSSQEYSLRPQPPPPPLLPHCQTQLVSKTETFSTGVAAAAPAVVVPAESPKGSGQSGKKRRGGPGGLNKLCGVSPEQTVVVQATLPRTELWAYIRKHNLQDLNNKRKIICNDELRLVFETDCTDMFKMNRLLAKHIITLDPSIKQLWAYIRKHNLQDLNNKRKIICNDELRLVFETDCTDMFKMNRLLAKHIITLNPSKQTAQNPKRAKIEEESGSKSEEAVSVVIISEALANFMGTSESEMSQADVLRQVWEYIKLNQLEDPLNALFIQCDAKLKELLGV